MLSNSKYVAKEYRTVWSLTSLFESKTITRIIRDPNKQKQDRMIREAQRNSREEKLQSLVT